VQFHTTDVDDMLHEMDEGTLPKLVYILTRRVCIKLQNHSML